MRRLWSLLFALSLVLAVSACGGEDDSQPPATGSVPTTGAAVGTTEAPMDETEQAVVYFAWDEKIASAGVDLGDGSGPADVVEALLEGPEGLASEIGMTTEIPDDTQLLGLEVEQGEAQVDLSSAFAAGGGSLSMQMRVAQVVFTLTRLAEIDTVTILLDGEPATEGVGGEGVPAVGVDRTDFTNVTPAILVESPLPGQAVSSPLTIAGLANTFEATVRYTVTDPEGLIIAEGFTTATAGNGTWGEFAVDVEYETDRSGLGAVIAFQDDAETGGQRDVYEVPVRMG